MSADRQDGVDGESWDDADAVVQALKLQQEIRDCLGKIDILNDLHFGIGADDLTRENLGKIMSIAESVRGLSNFAEWLTMNTRLPHDIDMAVKPVAELEPGNLIVYQAPLIGPQNLKIIKVFGRTARGHILFETESTSLFRPDLPPEIRFLELAPGTLIEMVTQAGPDDRARIDPHGIGRTYANVPSPTAGNGQMWDEINRMAAEHRVEMSAKPGPAVDPRLATAAAPAVLTPAQPGLRLDFGARVPPPAGNRAVSEPGKKSSVIPTPSTYCR